MTDEIVRLKFEVELEFDKKTLDTARIDTVVEDIAESVEGSAIAGLAMKVTVKQVQEEGRIV